MTQGRIVNPVDLNISISNVVASASLDQSFDLFAIFVGFKNTEHSPKEFPGLVFRLKKPNTNTHAHAKTLRRQKAYTKTQEKLLCYQL